MSRCFVLGAGFSKAVANLPLQAELIDRFMEIQQEAHDTGDRKTEQQGADIIGFVFGAEANTLRNYVDLKKEKLTASDLKHNLEALITLIDLHQKNPISYSVERDGRGISGVTSGLFPFNSLRTERAAIEKYLYLALSDAKDVDLELLGEFAFHLNPSDSILTFNYDVIIERGLFDQGKWLPRDGYGVVFDIDRTVSLEYDKKTTTNKVFKLHGSLNWWLPSWNALDPFNNDQLLWWFEDKEPIFPGYLADDTPENQWVIGYHGSYGVLPSYIKIFDLRLQIEVWRQAHMALASADEVVFIGYSLPDADGAAQLLFATSELAAKELTVVDPNWPELEPKFKRTTGNPHFRQHGSIEEYLQSI